MMHLQESGEMYLETIYLLSQTNPNVRAVDVSEHMGYSKPSVSRAVGILKNAGYLITDDSGYLVLTETGKEIAKKTYERHETLKNLFIRMGVSEDIASEDACKIEHVISEEVFAAIKKYFFEM
ncbi:MAG: metal-dependent transcriptional regulator [Clostridia bacterium]|nr:metal-dependent transcriptional regulator [Clostridia bacterium]